VLAVAAHIRAFVSGQPEAALEIFERSLHEDENSSFAWGMSAATCSYLGRPEDALDRLRNVWRLSPFDPLNFVYHTNAGIAEFVAGRYEEAIVWLQRARRENPKFFACQRTLAAVYGMAGHEEEARKAGQEMLAVDPAFRIGEFVARYPLRRPDDLNRYALGLRRAGLPE
jgi:adenylate cyclase